MDNLGPLHVVARENQYILVMSDHFKKWAEAVPNQRAAISWSPSLSQIDVSDSPFHFDLRSSVMVYAFITWFK